MDKRFMWGVVAGIILGFLLFQLMGVRGGISTSIGAGVSQG